MQSFSLYLCGVGGQGIGLLSEILLRAADHAGHAAKGVDTHGLAQRGGIVISQIRLGDRVHSPLIPVRGADLVAGLERHEALRGADAALRDGGTLVYYNTVLQPLPVRLGTAAETSSDDLKQALGSRGIAVHEVLLTGLADARMQNIAVLARINRLGLIPGVEEKHYLQAMADLMTGDMLKANTQLFREAG